MQNSNYYERFKDAPWYNPENSEMVLIGGTGGIGSWLAFFLARAGFSPTVFDDDIVEEMNIAGQLFRTSDVGKSKVQAVHDITRDFTGSEINGINGKYTMEEGIAHSFMFSAFDNMEARKTMFEKWKANINDSLVDPIFIDGRLNAEQMQILCVRKNDIEKYEQHLFSDSEVEDAPCAFKQTTHAAAMIASHMTAFFTNHITNIRENAMVRDIPFYYEFFIPITLTDIRDE